MYAAEFADGANISDKGVLGAILTTLGLDSAALLTRLEAPEIKQRLRQQTEERSVSVNGSWQIWWGARAKALTDAFATGSVGALFRFQKARLWS